MNNVLTLKNSAYLFHWSNDRFCFRSSYAIKKAYEAALRKNADMDEDGRTFQYEPNGYGIPCIYIGDLMLQCNDMMLQHIEGEYSRCDIINNISVPDVTKLDSKAWTHRGHGWTTSNRFTSLSIDTYSDFSLGFVQINFNGRSVRINFANGKIYAFRSEYREISTEQIFSILNVRSEKAKHEITTAIETLIKTTSL